jgi:cysteine desulfurase
VRERPARAANYRAWSEELAAATAPTARRTVAAAQTLPHICHLTVDGCRSEDVLVLLDRMGVAASAGSACASGALEPSHVLSAMGLATDAARSGLRFSFGWTTEDGDAAAAATALRAAVEMLHG